MGAGVDDDVGPAVKGLTGAEERRDAIAELFISERRPVVRGDHGTTSPSPEARDEDFNRHFEIHEQTRSPDDFP